MDCRCVGTHTLLTLIVVIIVTLYGVNSTDLNGHFGRSSRAFCPPGLSGEQCFYSQLYMYMRRHSSLTDPVSLRNIGKRNFPPKTTGNEKNILEQFHTGQRISEIVPDGSFTEMFQQPESLLANRDSEQNGDFQKLSSDPVSKGIRYLYRQKQNQKRSELAVNKRQIVCPAGMNRIECYNSALAYYYRLLRSIGDQ